MYGAYLSYVCGLLSFLDAYINVIHQIEEFF